MEKKQIILDFGSITLTAELFDSKVAAEFFENLPRTISLETWGGKLCGSIGIDLGTEILDPNIPPGGIGYINDGYYFCIFFGHKPEWSAEYIGQISGDSWKQLIVNPFNSVTIRPNS